MSGRTPVGSLQLTFWIDSLCRQLGVCVVVPDGSVCGGLGHHCGAEFSVAVTECPVVDSDIWFYIREFGSSVRVLLGGRGVGDSQPSAGIVCCLLSILFDPSICGVVSVSSAERWSASPFIHSQSGGHFWFCVLCGVSCTLVVRSELFRVLCVPIGTTDSRFSPFSDQCEASPVVYPCISSYCQVRWPTRQSQSLHETYNWSRVFGRR